MRLSVLRICLLFGWFLVSTSCASGNDSLNNADTGVGDSGVGDSGVGDEPEDVYPDEDWLRADPASHGFDVDRLEEAAAIADEKETHCLTAVHKGVIIGEWYFDDWDPKTEQNVFSITKSFTSAAVGIASDMGFLDVTDPASLYISEWQNTPSEEVTVAELLSQTSGRYWEVLSDTLGIGSAEDMTGFATALDQQASPGAEWMYNNAAVQTLDRVMTEATGKALDEFATENLLSQIGMTSTFSKDSVGNTITYSDLFASCTDLARFGYLLLKKGRWKNQQIVSEEYLDAALSPSSQLNTAYGYLFWLNRDGHWIQLSISSETGKIEGDGKMYPGLPEDMVSAAGLQEQLIAVFPSFDLVVTRLGGKGDAVSAFLSGDTSDNAFTEELLSTILSAKID